MPLHPVQYHCGIVPPEPERRGDDDVRDVAAFFGRGFRDRQDADTALIAYVAGDSSADRTAELVRLFARRALRQHALLGPPDSLIVRHPPLQTLPDRRSAGSTRA